MNSDTAALAVSPSLVDVLRAGSALVAVWVLSGLLPTVALAADNQSDDIDGLNGDSVYNSGTDLGFIDQGMGIIDVIFGPMGFVIAGVSLGVACFGLYFGRDVRQGLQKLGKWALATCALFGGLSGLNMLVDGAMM